MMVRGLKLDRCSGSPAPYYILTPGYGRNRDLKMDEENSEKYRYRTTVSINQL